jgi:tetratricopeptide (TPR) repeat protein
LLTDLLSRLFAAARRSNSPADKRSGADLLETARALHDRGDDAGAERCCRQLIAGTPGHALAHQLLGLLLAQRGQHADAEQHLRAALAAAPELVEAHLALGNVRWLQGDSAGARLAYEAAALLRPDDAAAYCNLGLLHQRSGDREAALTAYRRAHTLAPNYPNVVAGIAAVCIALGKFDFALEFLHAEQERRPGRCQVLKFLALVLHAMHRPEEAVGFYRETAAIDGRDAELLVNYGVALRDLGLLDEALASFDAAIALDSRIGILAR